MNKPNDRSSFQILRTNPKLTSNVKLTVTSNDSLSLNSINSDPQLNTFQLKNYKVSSSGSYSWDLYKFWQGYNKNLIYRLFNETDRLNVQPDFDLQYDQLYWSGASTINSKLYSEEFSYFAPLWVDIEIPDYFMVFRVDGPSYVKLSGITDPSQLIYNQDFKTDILDKASIVKIFSLQEDTNLGTYIRNHINDPAFTSEPVFINWDKRVFSQYSGISLSSGGFIQSSQNIVGELTARDRTVLEFDNYITQGFERNNVVAPNILNLEFLFDDEEASDFSINRYFGLYVSKQQMGIIRPDVIESSSLYTRVKGKVTWNDNSYKIKKSQLNDPSLLYMASDDNIKLLHPTQSIRPNFEFFLRDTNITENELTQYEIIYNLNNTLTDNLSHAYITVQITDRPINADWLQFGAQDDNNKVFASSTLLDEGSNDGKSYSIRGDLTNIAIAMAKAINSIEDRVFYATAIGTNVIVRANDPGVFYNNLWFDRRSDFINNPIITISNGNNWIGGNDNSRTKVSVDADIREYITTNDIYVQQGDEFILIDQIFDYLDDPVLDGFGNPTNYNNYESLISIQLPFEYSDSTITFYQEIDIDLGKLKVFNVRDFDTDTFSTEYGEVKNKSLLSYYDLDATVVGNEILSDDIKNNFNEFFGLWGYENQLTGDLPEIDSEYERLNENFLKEIILESKVVPFINKWVTKGTNVFDNPYRLNNSEAFGVLNFTPSFQINEPNSQYYTHEWYYYSKFPHYFNRLGSYEGTITGLTDGVLEVTDIIDPNTPTNYNKELNLKESVNIFFNDSINENSLKGIDSDYFQEYFTYDNIIASNGSIRTIPTQFRYSVFSGGTNNTYSSAFFRGVNVLIKERKESDITIDFNLQSIETIKSTKFNGYKFSAVLSPEFEYIYDGGAFTADEYNLYEPKSSFSLNFIRNEKFKTVTLLIKYKAYKILFERNGDKKLINHYIPDPVFLYSARDLKYEGDLIDINLTGYINLSISGDSFYDNNEGLWNIIGSPIGSNLPAYTNEVNINANGIYNQIWAYDNTGTLVSIIDNITTVSSNNLLKATNVYYNPNGIDPDNLLPTDLITIGKNSVLYWLSLRYVYKEGGFNLLTETVNNLSFGNIAALINEGDPNINYVTIKEDGTEITEDFLIELEEPTAFGKARYLNTDFDNNKPTSLTVINTIGYNLTTNENIQILPFSRYSARYLPKFNDVLRFINGKKVPEAYRDENTIFDINHTDFGKIKNHFYLKVNPNSPGNVLRVKDTLRFNSVYYLINETAIEKKDLDTFKGTWDPEYFRKYNSFNSFVNEMGTKNIFERKSYFGSKMMKIKDSLFIDTLNNELASNFNADDLAFNDTELIYTNSQTNIQVTCFLEKRIIRHLFELNADQIFYDYINADNTRYQTVNDFITDYFYKNILPRYQVRSVNVWLRNSNSKLQPIVTNLTDSQKVSQGYNRITNFNLSFRPSSNFDFDLNYTYNRSKFSFQSLSFSFEIEKR